MNNIERHHYRRAIHPRWKSWLAGLLVAWFAIASGATVAAAETRTLKIYFVHTGEKAEVVYKRNGRYDQAGLRKLSMLIRDFRRNEPTKMDPRLFDLVWSVYKGVGARDYIHVVSGYRSPTTNSMLRSRSKGVAKRSQHMLGKAMDFYIPGVSLKKLRETGMKMQVGGVGYYPRSGSPFVHMDVGNVRHWPRMSRRELVALFPNGKTLHVPSDGKPLPGFEQALASYEARKKSGASAVAFASPEGSKKSKGLFAALFGGGEDEDEEAGVVEEAAPVVKPARQPKQPEPVAVATAVPQSAAPAKPVPSIQIVSPEDAQRVDLPVAQEPAVEPPAAVEETPETILAALPARAVPVPAVAPRPAAEVGVEVATVSTGYPAEAISDTPADIPFGIAQDDPVADAVAAETTEVAAAVPLPTPRPNIAVASDDRSESDADDAALMALVSADSGALATSVVPMPIARPADEQNEDAQKLADRAAVAAAIKANAERVEKLETVEASSRRVATKGLDPETVASLSVKTTPKAARAKRTDAGPDPKARVRAAEPDAARWVLDENYTASTTRPSATAVAYKSVVTAPHEVYTQGFTKNDDGVANANRFTGKAVTFMSVARFE